MKNTKTARLKTLYPTLAELEKEIEKYGCVSKLAYHLKMSRTTITDYRATLGGKGVVRSGRRYMKDCELDENIRKVVESAGVTGVGEAHQWMGRTKI